MGIPSVLAEIYGGILVLTGLTVLNKKYFDVVLNELENSKALVWLTGVVTFTIGITMVTFYNVWGSDWRVVVTLFGWLTLVKGALIALFPVTVMRFYQRFKGAGIIMFGGIIAIVLGVVLLYLGSIA